MDNYIPSFTNMNVQPHTHNGSDSQQIAPENLLPYTENIILATNPTINGTIRMYDLFAPAMLFNQPGIYDFGFQIFSGNQWNKLDIADFYLFASQATPQVIGAGGNAIIVFDMFATTDEFPVGSYNSGTGVFTLPAPTPSIALVIVTIDFAAGAAAGTFTVNIPGEIAPTITYATQAVAFSIEYVVGVWGVSSSISIQVTNNTAGALTTTGASIIIKQMK